MAKVRFLSIPFLILFLSIAIDRIITLDFFQDYYSKTLSHLNFLNKPELYEDLKEYLRKDPKERKKVLVFLGNSRSLMFPVEQLAEKNPEWILYNFSVPGGTPDYFHYWVEKIESDGLRPDFVVIDQSIEVFNKTPILGLDEVLVYGIPISFMIRHWNYYSTSDWSTVISKGLFHTYRDRPKLAVILDRMKNHSELANMYHNAKDVIVTNLRLEKGSYSSDINMKKALAYDLLLKRSESDFLSYMSPYTFYSEMMDMQKESIRILKKQNIPYATIWVRVSRPYYKLYSSKIVQTQEGMKSPQEVWMPLLEQFNRETGTILWNMNEEPNYNCDSFSDPGHMSPGCFYDYGEYVFKKLNETLK
ncbi:hypothetical protein CH373_17875 [Leptospira perolatii]|uniref:DUF1574 domain-containing protein n=1 Tax=Leptospira perolatii TaxID=2023191 RepID=A0A2M9ZI51_9LEPT|nr:DUF1574 domain-containing protein [Leptospira perolatii]PJZ68117.1 hypothetical protein CH360_17820 [Leptospira perolatii]PJZ71738.1 hypothetical protein CH373_17875 [Leptospira perolatii]